MSTPTRNVSTALTKRAGSERVPRPDEIAVRAYELFQKRGGHHGHDREDWYEAEVQLARERGTHRERD